MWLREPLGSDLPPLCAAMRANDAAEIYALRDHRDPVRLAGELWRALPFALAALVAGLDDVPCAIAFLGIWPKGCRELGDASLFATAKFPRVARPLIRHIRAILIPSLIEGGVRRVECRALETYTASHRMIAAMGARRECLLPDVGPDGMAYVQFAWTKTYLANTRSHASRREKP